MARQTLIVSLLVPLLLCGGRALGDDSEVEALRAQLRSTVLQLRQLQDQQAAPPAPAAPTTATAADAAALKAKLAATQARLRAAQHSAAAAVALQEQLTKAQADNAALTTAAATNATELAKFKAAYAQAEEDGRAVSGERDHLKAQLAQTSNIAAACQAKNARLTALAEAMLADYRKINLGGVLSAREPLFGLRRVQLENIDQDHEDAIRAAHCDVRLDAAWPPKPAAAPAGAPG